jgi:hypothetical protein
VPSSSVGKVHIELDGTLPLRKSLPYILQIGMGELGVVVCLEWNVLSENLTLLIAEAAC